MRRIARHLFTLCPAASLLLCVAVCALWVRSYWQRDNIGGHTRQRPDGWQRGGYVYSAAGVIGCDWWFRQNTRRTGTGFEAGWAYESWSSAGQQYPNLPWHRFSYASGTYDPRATHSYGAPRPLAYKHELTLPHWAAVAATLVLPVISLKGFARRRRERRRAKQRLCPKCGYDLRASPERCPECGALSPAEGSS